jgi:hypothetical protein
MGAKFKSKTNLLYTFFLAPFFAFASKFEKSTIMTFNFFSIKKVSNPLTKLKKIHQKKLYVKQARGPAENIVQHLERQVILDKPVYCLWSSARPGSNSFPRPSAGRRAYNAGNHRLNKVFVSVPCKNIVQDVFSGIFCSSAPPTL